MNYQVWMCGDRTTKMIIRTDNRETALATYMAHFSIQPNTIKVSATPTHRDH